MEGLSLDMSGTEGVLHTELEGVVMALEWVAAGIDLLSILIMLMGAARFVWGVARSEASRVPERRVQGLNAERMALGRYILAGLELLIVSDIIHTALSLALGDLVFLGLLVLIRATVSYFLDREIRDIREEMSR
ncbi:DUF1622 domain-containing protein [Tranquillimonas alkanivorans]|uniref:Uncharacterized membrane protein n=1 Tax=Tranquillimonas alkanivorans TaxID=441119 RepID=A0A1I5M5A0_9RHOB|nr:DUF1622 domain-containing protein [Tranquillimonas alkanivorans]SFP04497.1 Uncharacterized membrane protein [Tranquillimonas alkanivorans]